MSRSHDDWLGVVLSSLGDAVITTDTRGNVTFLNPIGQSLTGWTQEEAAGMPLDAVFRIVNEETRLPAENPAARALAEGVIVELANHTLLIAKDGTEHPISDSAAPIRSAEGEVSGVVLVFRDVSGGRRMERALQESLRYAEDVIATLREPFLVLDQDLRILEANRAFYRTFQVTAEDTKDRFVYDLGNGQWDIPRLRHLLEEVLPLNQGFEDFEVEHDFLDLGRRSMLLNARRIHRDDQTADLILLAIEDVTERRRAEEARRELESRYTSLIKNIQDHSVFMLDVDGRITSWNLAAEQILGYSEAEILGRHFSVIFTPEDREAGLPEREMRLARDEGRAEDERWHLRKDGERFWALGIVTPMYDADGQLQGYSKILRDMTDRKRAEELLQRQSEALRQADRSKDEFLAMLSHELRNPMAPIRNAAQVIRLVGAADPNVQRAAEMIERQVAQMNRLVEDLLDASRITSRKIRLRKEWVELSTILARAVETSRPSIDLGRHQLTVSLTPEPVWLQADTTRLAQVFSNLLNNAAKFTQKGGRIGVTVERTGDEVAVRVRDNGVGIAPELLPRVFELFSQGDRSLARSEGGLGIGLSLARELVEMHGGRVEAFSGPALGEGSEIVVTLPLLSPEAPADAGEVSAPGTSGPALRVLVVDDNVDSAESLATLLRISGHQVRETHSGRAALEAAAEDRLDVILLDIGLPEMDGYEVARRLRQHPEHRHTPLIAVTGYGQEGDLRLSRELGFVAHLIKPLEIQELKRLLAELGAGARVEEMKKDCETG